MRRRTLRLVCACCFALAALSWGLAGQTLAAVLSALAAILFVLGAREA